MNEVLILSVKLTSVLRQKNMKARNKASECHQRFSMLSFSSSYQFKSLRLSIPKISFIITSPPFPLFSKCATTIRSNWLHDFLRTHMKLYLHTHIPICAQSQGLYAPGWMTAETQLAARSHTQAHAHIDATTVKLEIVVMGRWWVGLSMFCDPGYFVDGFLVK